MFDLFFYIDKILNKLMMINLKNKLIYKYYKFLKK